MGITAVVINAGLGDITLGLEMAGFKVIAAYEADEKALNLHRINIPDTPVYLLSDGNIIDYPKADLLAARIYNPSLSKGVRTPHMQREPSIDKICEVLTIRKPRTFFLLFNASSFKNMGLQARIDELAKLGYQCIHQVVEVAQGTGFPVYERNYLVAGSMQGEAKPVMRLLSSVIIRTHEKDYLQLEQPVDQWYHDVGATNILPNEDDAPFYCWKRSQYVGTESIVWHPSDGRRKIGACRLVWNMVK